MSLLSQCMASSWFAELSWLKLKLMIITTYQIKYWWILDDIRGTFDAIKWSVSIAETFHSFIETSESCSRNCKEQQGDSVLLFPYLWKMHFKCHHPFLIRHCSDLSYVHGSLDAVETQTGMCKGKFIICSLVLEMCSCCSLVPCTILSKQATRRSSWQTSYSFLCTLFKSI